MKKGKNRAKATSEKIHSETVPHKYVASRAYDINNPAVKLLNMIGGGFFNEPRYYETDRSYAEFFKDLAINGKITKTKLDASGLNEQAKEVISTAIDVANSDNPELLLVLAAWARDPENGLKIRTTPQILLAVAAAHNKTKPYVRMYAPLIIRRADEIRQVFAAFRHLFQSGDKGWAKGSLPNCLKQALSDSFTRFSEYELLKYNDTNKPSFKDVLLMVKNSKNLSNKEKMNGYPLSKGLFEYIVNGKITDNSPQIVKNRDKFFKMTNIDEVTDKIVKEAGLTWENIISKFGSSQKTWELAIPIMGEMALIRNLRNFERTNISNNAWKLVEKKLLNVEQSKQLPFRYFAALNEISSGNCKTLLSKQLDKSCENLKDLGGVSAVFTDNSGSMSSATISKDSQITLRDASNNLAAIFSKRYGNRSKIGVFGSHFKLVECNNADSCLTIKQSIDDVGNTVGHSTDAWKCFRYLLDKQLKVDRIILLSDMCCYNSSSNYGASVAQLFEEYKRKINKNARLYSINLAGYSQSQLSPNDKNVYLMSGWSEQIFTLISDIESGQSDSQNKNIVANLPTLNILEEKYGNLARNGQNEIDKTL